MHCNIFQHLLIFFLIIINGTVSAAEKYNHINYRLTCDGSTNRSTPGLITFIPVLLGNDTHNSNKNHSNITASDCQYECFHDSECLSAKFYFHKSSNRKGECKIYNVTDDNKKFVLDEDLYFEFTECLNNSPDVCKRKDDQGDYLKSDRCPGFWVQYYNHSFINDEAFIQSEKISDLTDAQRICLRHNSCSGIAKINSSPSVTFHLYRDWPEPLELNLKASKEGDSAFIWLCGNCKDESIQPNWKITENVDPPRDVYYFSSFYTVSSHRCIEECQEQNKQYTDRQCDTVYFSNMNHLCLVQAKIDSSSCSQQLNLDRLLKNKSMDRFSNKGTKYEVESMSDREEALRLGYKKPPQQCVCFVEEADVYNDSCGQPDQLIGKHIKGLALIRETLTRPLKNESGVHVYRFFTGYEHIWIALNETTSKNFCSPSNCELFSAEILPQYVNLPVKIHSRRDWGASNFTMSDVLPQINNVIVRTTVWPKCGCLTFDGCSDTIRAYVDFYIRDMKFRGMSEHFFISNDGQIYEGIGWKNVGRIAVSYVHNSLIVAFIGHYGNCTPSLAALNGLKAFLQQSVRNGNLPNNYTLYSLVDIIDHSTNITLVGEKLRLILSNWRNYKGRFKEEEFCNGFILLLATILPSIVVLLMVLVVATLFYTGVFHLKFCRSLRDKLFVMVKCARSIEVWSYPRLNFEEIKLIDSRIKLNRESQNFHLNFMNFGMIYVNRSTKCSCTLFIKELYNYARKGNLSYFLELLMDSYFLKHCHKKTCIVLIEPKEHLEPSFLIAIHVDLEESADSIVRKLISGNICFCKKLIMELCLEADKPKQLSDEDNEIEETPTKLNTNSWYSGIYEHYQRIAYKGQEIRFKYLGVRMEQRQGDEQMDDDNNQQE